MRGRLGSHRFRRRLAWCAFALAALFVVVGGSILIGNTGKSTKTPVSNKPAWVYHEPKLHKLSQRERLDLLDTSSHFVDTAVARRRLDEAWDLLGPEMRAGQTRRSWDSGTNNVVPFPVAAIIAWKVLYSYENDVAFDLALAAKPGEDLVGKSFTIELKRYPSRGNRWLVAAWVPKGVSGAGQSKSAAATAAEVSKPTKATLSARWLFVPLAALGLIVLVPLLLGLRTYVVHRRRARRYAEQLAAYRSSSSPS
jgi:hypothetical protein